MLLNQIAVGKEVIITQILAQGALRGRLFDLGLTRGTLIMIQKRAPLGDPMEIKIRGYELSIRDSEAKYIAVEEVKNA
jgi:Fe2+ transport system protein FeoA